MRNLLRLALVTALVSFATLASCRAPSPPCSPDLAVRRNELAEAQRQVAARAAGGDFIGAVVGALAPTGFYNAALLTVGPGPAAARTFLERDSLNAKSRARWIVVRLDVSADGNDGYSYGYLDLIRQNGDTQPGQFKAYWRRSASGQWQLLAMGRGRRALGPLTLLPDSMRTAATMYRAWPMRDTSEAWGTLKATEVAFSDSAGIDGRAAFMSFAAPDGGKIAGASYVFGRAAIGAGIERPPPELGAFRWYARWGSVAGSNDLGFNVGPVERLSPPPDASPGPAGLFFTVWRRQPNGEWKWLVD